MNIFQKMAAKKKNRLHKERLTESLNFVKTDDIGILKKRFKDYLEKDFSQNYCNLIKGLDDKSAELVCVTINRLLKSIENQTTQECKFEPLECEKELMAINKRDFHNQIIQCSDEIFAYKRYLLPKNHFYANTFHFKNGIFEIENPAALKNKNFIDVGAYIGDSAIVFAEYTYKKVYSFEAVKDNYEIMLKTIELNKVSDKVIPILLGLGDKNEYLEIASDGGGSNFAGFSPYDCENPKEKAPVVTLDSFVKQNNISDIGLIKTDIEGFEQNFLQGAKETIKRDKPVLLISIYHSAQDFFEIKPMIENWDLGYTFKIRSFDPGSVYGEIMLIAQV